MGNIEIEAKMPLRDAAALERRLRELGAKPGPVTHEVNTFFDTDQGLLKSLDQGLRLRVQQQPDGSQLRVMITHKGPRAHGRLKSRSEIEVQVNDARAAAALLTALGFSPVFSFEKRRRHWDLDDCSVDIDCLPYLGDFLEIEGPSDEAVLAVREKLGFGQVPLIRASYISMLTTYLAEHHLPAGHIRFESAKGP